MGFFRFPFTFSLFCSFNSLWWSYRKFFHCCHCLFFDHPQRAYRECTSSTVCFPENSISNIPWWVTFSWLSYDYQYAPWLTYYIKNTTIGKNEHVICNEIKSLMNQIHEVISIRQLGCMIRKIGYQNLIEHRTSNIDFEISLTALLALKVIQKWFWRHMKCNTLLLKSYVCIGIINLQSSSEWNT